jgi:S-DNA-T family DNA segregation ATPase FtsK/SpoIIIE
MGVRTAARATPSPLPEKIGTLLAGVALARPWAPSRCFFPWPCGVSSKDDPGWSHAVVTGKLHNPTGHAGAWVADLLLYLFGFSAWWWIVLLAVVIWWGFRRLHSPLGNLDRRPLYIALAGFALLLVASSALEALRFHTLKVELPLAPGGMLGMEASRLLEHQLGYTGSTLLLLAAMAAGWSIFSGMSWLWAFESLGGALEAVAGFFYGLLDSWRDRRIGREVAIQREEEVEVEKRRVELHDPIIIETPPAEVPISKKAEKRIEREKQVALFPEVIIGGQLPPLHLLDPAPPATETVGAETLEYTSRLIERSCRLRRRGEGARGDAGAGHHALRDRAGGRRQGRPDRQPRADLARALSGLDPRRRDDPRQVVHGARDSRTRSGRWSSCRDHLEQAYNDMASPLTLPRQGHRRQARGRRPREDAAPARRRHDRLGQVGRVNAMILSLLYKATPERGPADHDRPEDARALGVRGHPAPACAGRHRHEAGRQRAATGACRDGARYKLMSNLGVRNLAGYNQQGQGRAQGRASDRQPVDSLMPETPEPLEDLPMIVVVIDELADLMMVVGKKVEELIARLAQKARASAST